MESDDDTVSVPLDKDAVAKSRWQYHIRRGNVILTDEKIEKELNRLKSELLSKSAWPHMDLGLKKADIVIEIKLSEYIHWYFSSGDTVYFSWNNTDQCYNLTSNSKRPQTLNLDNLDSEGQIIKMDQKLIRKYMISRLLVLPVALFAAVAGVGAWQLSKRKRHWK
jgi:hypothetical protein